MLHNIYMEHGAYDILSFESILLDETTSWCQEMVVEHHIDGTRNSWVYIGKPL